MLPLYMCIRGFAASASLKRPIGGSGYQPDLLHPRFRCLGLIEARCSRSTAT